MVEEYAECPYCGYYGPGQVYGANSWVCPQCNKEHEITDKQ